MLLKLSAVVSSWPQVFICLGLKTRIND